ncbi:aspartyl/asparaginyl beta-hydroxylase domain-containing protein [Burkholderia diffusa]|uniref:aspartyl/asparaginyl beta-hydroxylase domain-containing protein n=1 Tax=Burkholderia diffusa TaxID=488732 RepID=UPI00075AED17|nr:aspartyl/asparaginyl beta-hydroxylase domain-containing protein [Burkholderia diffusa]KVM90589.1 hypothetical protein WJ62_03025 [Burkholderia diffusa]
MLSNIVRYDPTDFPFIQAFIEKWEAIRDEALSLDSRIIPVHRSGPHEQYVDQLIYDNGWMPSWQVGSVEPNHGWLTYGLGYQGRIPLEAPRKYPTVHRLLGGMVGYKVCAFSRMMPRSFIAPHNHPELGGDLLTLHLGIDVPDKYCYLNVAGTFFSECNGIPIVFDGSQEHFALNMSEHPRTVLYMEFFRSKAALTA